MARTQIRGSQQLNASFLDLNDTPVEYGTSAGFLTIVNETGDGIVFRDKNEVIPSVVYHQQIYTSNGTQRVYTLNAAPVLTSMIVSLGGMALTYGASNDYTVSGTTFTINNEVFLDSGMMLSITYVQEFQYVGLNIAYINDTITSPDYVWSSYKTNSVINSLINDATTSLSLTWSSNKINSQIGALINDATSSTTLTWSSNKIGTELTNALNISSTPSNGTVSGVTSTMTVDVNSLGFAALLSIDTDGHLIMADADTTALCTFLAVETGTGSKKVLLQGFVTNSSWTWNPKEALYLSSTGGQMTQTAPSVSGDVIQVIGYAVTATTIYFNPDSTYLTVQ